ncbi:Crotonobetainyl-CoA:carnitine CoA-transferase CaiB [Novosphingobium sp. CF614]|uniref:CaiB/BaiF CoA transferase family protein n=1 Tax=Novosphingobium sp. CF614 TaxID=1884364 RepID=UPI0008E19982|nr:CoA transferase [Novosphingobium sp. CF614]SFF90186.1 Crotonobetainyl-CoA:carnitine CoA-transferase CaiB [Novosphingobium sp. CF614]
MTGACAGLRVLDLSTHDAGSLAAMVLADYGAEVILVESAREGHRREKPSFLLLNRGKKSISLDLETAEGRAALHRLIPAVDVVIETMSPAEAARKGVTYEALRALRGDIVHCSITGYGRNGPFAEVKADDALVMAKAGIFRDQPGWHQDGVRPVFRSTRDATMFSGMLALQGVLAAIRLRDLTGKGQHVDLSMLAALSCRQNPKVRWLLREGEELPAEGSGGTEVQSEKHVLPHHLDPRQTNLIGMRVETADGRWLVHSHTEPHFFPAWIEAIEMTWIWGDERFKGAPHKFDKDADRVELTELLKARMKEKTAAEWIDAYLANGNVCGDMVQTTQDALRHRQSVGANLVVTVEDPQVGAVLQIGPLAKISNAPASVLRSAPAAGEHDAEILGQELQPFPRRETAGSAAIARPLEGVTVVEAAYYYATPFATALLAEMGARIIKIEPLRGDPYRSLANAGRGDPVLNLGHNNMVRAMQGKESISLDLKSAEGKKILRGLIEKADVFIHCFRKSVPESLGIDEASLRQINPDIVYHYGASYGAIGPYSRQPAIDPIIAAYAGTTAQQAGRGNAPLSETGADPVAATGHASAMLLGLFARDRTGKGQSVESAMIISNIFHNYEDALSYAGKPDRPQPDAYQFGMNALYRLYETAPAPAGSVFAPYQNQNPRWVFLSAETDAEFSRFCTAAGRDDLAGDARFATVAARRANDDALAGELAKVFQARSAHDWQELLLAAGVGCVQADAMSNFAFLYKDEQTLANDFTVLTEHPSIGRYWRHAPLLRFSETPGAVTSTSVQGEFTRSILAELGYDEPAMEQLRTDGVVSWPEGAEALAPA